MNLGDLTQSTQRFSQSNAKGFLCVPLRNPLRTFAFKVLKREFSWRNFHTVINMPNLLQSNLSPL